MTEGVCWKLRELGQRDGKEDLGSRLEGLEFVDVPKAHSLTPNRQSLTPRP